MPIEPSLPSIQDFLPPPDSIATLPSKAVDLAAALLEVSEAQRTHSEHRQDQKMGRMMGDPRGKAMTLALTDQVFRPENPKKSAALMRSLIERYGIPVYLPLHERFALALGGIASRIAPTFVMKAVTAKMRGESSQVILSAEDEKLSPFLAKRKQEHSRMNINLLGEAILGEEEAAKRLATIVKHLKSPQCDYISVKISAICSQINLVDAEETIRTVQDRLRTLYRTALLSSPHKFVNLDMEEYRDLHLTVKAFQRTLDEPEFQKLSAGIVLQAYLPDSYEVQKALTQWALQRTRQGAAPIKIRLVKGANLAMEKVDASLHGWPLATYDNKLDVDANYKRMLHFACQPDHAAAVRIGVASHNLFDISYALLLRAAHGVEDHIELEMLEGMASHQARAVQKVAGGLLRYAPVVKYADFHSAISYLVRRLDENTHEENFLHDLFDMQYGDEKWNKQKHMFLAACARISDAPATPARTQDRHTETLLPQLPGHFENCPDTDWSLPQNQTWISEKIQHASTLTIPKLPLQIGGEYVLTHATGTGWNPSRNAASYEFSLANQDDVHRALSIARETQPAWNALGISGRADLLRAAALEIARSRGDTIATMVRDAGKSAAEADAEISEAIDFANYYADSLDRDGIRDGTEITPLGIVAIAPPWNFPYAIPCGGILAALMAGNTVIFKPAPQTVLTAWHLANHLWNAGIPKSALQFLPCPDDDTGRLLITSADAVVLTGSYETGRLFQGWKPHIRLFAETSGKNSLIITNAADLDLAIKDLVKSAFGHAGQKCSAASLAILEADVYDNQTFLKQLRDAAASLHVGPSWPPTSTVTPLVLKPEHNLKHALTSLDLGESWILEPTQRDDNPHSWSPGIKYGVQPGSWFHKTECFGPVLGLIRADNLTHAIQIQNDSHFGLTGGIHSLDPREIAFWRERVEVGNAYINRSITGAIVQRQPFGGWKKSCFGPGAKAGGPNYVSIFGHWKQSTLPSRLSEPTPEARIALTHLTTLLPEWRPELQTAAASFSHWWRTEFSIEHDPSQLHGETNHFRYVPLSRVFLRADGMGDYAIALVILAAATAGVSLHISLAEAHSWLVSSPLAAVFVESEPFFAERLKDIPPTWASLRAPNASLELLRAAHDAGLSVNRAEPLSNGRLELLRYLREQSISECSHRYGNPNVDPRSFT